MKDDNEMNDRQIFWATGVGAASAVISLFGCPGASATPADGGLSGGARDSGSTLGVGGPASYTGGSTVNNFCEPPLLVGGGPTSSADDCGGSGATAGVGGPTSYTGGSTDSNRGGTATLGVGGVNSYTDWGNPGAAQNGTNSTDRIDNYGGTSPPR